MKTRPAYSATIVEQTAPEGDQFLFLSAPGGSRIEVTFVDPEAGDEERVAEAHAEHERKGIEHLPGTRTGLQSPRPMPRC